ncbi:2-dehydropantoate 2-reductase [Tabrizicola sp. KVB23]|uniref:2-dehydropantoate 2-reductase n=2 Tax=Fuscibacter oryzae TaxID=2803939 RepID=A0A8J7SR95_9RHOB|nr:2-dehydropantoate 2-reductase [Fuscibacter oryzae]
MGAGAVGCYYGALLAQAGEDVTLIGRPALVQAVARQGLLLEKGGQTAAIALTATDSPAGVAGANVVIIAVKSGDSAEAARQIAPHLAPDATILSLQNGISNGETLAATLGRPVIPVVVYVATDMAGPGHVRHHGRGELVFAPGPRAEPAAARFRAAGIDAQVSPDAATALWTKFAINCCFNAVSALTRQPYGTIAAQPGALDTMRVVLDECCAVAKAEGIPLPDDLWHRIEAITHQMAGQFSSTAQDMMRGKPTEIDYLNGEIHRRAARHGIATPVNTALWALVKLAEKSA